MTLPRSSLAVMLAALVAAGCSDSDSSPPAMPQTPPETPAPTVHNLELPAGDLGSLAAGMLMLGAGDTATRGNVEFSCPAGGDACSIEVMDSVGTLTAQSTGGMATAMMVEMLEDPMPTVHMLELPAGDLGSLGAGMLMLGAGDTATRGNVEFSCPAGGDACSIEVTDSLGTLTAKSTGGMATAMMVEMHVDPDPAVHSVMLPSGAKAGGLSAGNTMVTAGASRMVGNFVFTCAAGAMDCNIEVYENLGVLMAKSTGGMATVIPLSMYLPGDTPTSPATAFGFLNDEMLPDISMWKMDGGKLVKPMTKKEAFAAAITGANDTTTGVMSHIELDNGSRVGVSGFSMVGDGKGMEYSQLAMAGGYLRGDTTADSSDLGGFDGYSLMGALTTGADRSWTAEALVFSDGAEDGATNFGIWAADFGDVHSADLMRVGVFAQLPSMAGSSFADDVLGGMATYSGGAAGFIAGNDMNDVWTGVVDLNANFTQGNETIGGMIRSGSIPTITLSPQRVDAISTMMKGRALAKVAGAPEGRWNWAFSDDAGQVGGTVDVSNIIGAFGAHRNY